MINLYKEIISFLLYRKLLKAYQVVELNDIDKIKLEALDKDILDKVYKKAYEHLCREMLENNLSTEYVLWYKHAIAVNNSFYRKFNK